MVSASVEPDLWPALADTLARLAERALFHGVLQGYRRRRTLCALSRGRIRIGDQLSRRPGQMIPLEVSYDEFTHDITENRILRSAGCSPFRGSPRMFARGLPTSMPDWSESVCCDHGRRSPAGSAPE